MTEFGVFYQVYKNHKAVRFVLENFRKHFPDNPVVLISDGGDDFTYMADEFNCKFFMRENILVMMSISIQSFLIMLIVQLNGGRDRNLYVKKQV